MLDYVACKRQLFSLKSTIMYISRIRDGTGQIRTGDVALRRRSLYPAELQPQVRSTHDHSSFSETAKSCPKVRRLFLIHTENFVLSGCFLIYRRLVLAVPNSPDLASCPDNRISNRFL